MKRSLYSDAFSSAFFSPKNNSPFINDSETLKVCYENNFKEASQKFPVLGSGEISTIEEKDCVSEIYFRE